MPDNGQLGLIRRVNPALLFQIPFRIELETIFAFAQDRENFDRIGQVKAKALLQLRIGGAQERIGFEFERDRTRQGERSFARKGVDVPWRARREAHSPDRPSGRSGRWPGYIHGRNRILVSPGRSASRIRVSCIIGIVPSITRPQPSEKSVSPVTSASSSSK